MGIIKTGKINLRKNILLIFIILLVFLCFSYFSQTKTNNKLNWDVYTIQFSKSEQRNDNPWGFSSGLIEFEDEECVFLTPGTQFVISNIHDEFNNSSQAKIHPAVCDVSDGTNLTYQILDSEENIIDEQTLDIPSNKEWTEIKFEKENRFKVVINCGSQGKGDENGDWVVIRSNSSYKSQFGSDGYVRSATFFGDSWPLNFWNNEINDLDRDFKQIRNDGFNSVILVIPWKEFQPSVSPIEYNDYPFEKLDQIMNAALIYNLDVYTRIGYLWDYYNDTNENCINRFIDLMHDEETHEAWLQYCEKMYSCLSGYKNFKGAFLSWEDFWRCLTICDIEDIGLRTDYAKDIGYQKWINENYSLKHYNQAFNCNYSGIEDIPVPSRDEAAMESFYRFFDEFLNGLLIETQGVFPDISMEVRLDDDVVNKSDPESFYYSHNSQYSCGNADYTVTAYGIHMGFENIGEKVSAEDALKNTERIIRKLSKQNNHKSIYIDQFLFSDNTPRFSYNAQIIEDQISTYLSDVSDILSEYTKGYGIWTYRNYRNNMLYNPQFGLYDSGWIMTGNPQFNKASDSVTCTLNNGDTLFQEIPEVRDRFPSEQYTVSFDLLSHNADSILKIRFGETDKAIDINDNIHYEISLNRNGSLNISFELLSGSIEIDNLCLYSFVQEGQLYSEGKTELEFIDDIRNLNKRLVEH